VIAAFLSNEFLRHALFAGLLASVACGLVGSLVVVRRLSYLAGGIAHSCYGGVGLGYFFGFSPILGATGFALLSALGIGWADRRLKRGAETVISVIWAGGMALGVLLVALKPGYAPNLGSYLFGNILFVPERDLWLMVGLDLLLLAVVTLLYRPLLAAAYDEEFMAVGNLPVTALYLLQLLLVALTVVLLIRVVGIILVIALLTIPASLALQYVRSLKGMMVVASALGMVFTTAGLLGSYALDRAGLPAPSGALIILAAVFTYGLTALLRGRLRRSARPQA